MHIKQKKGDAIRESLYIEAEADANAFNLKCLAILSFISILSEILNEIGLFKVPLLVMRLSVVLATVLFSLPLAIFLIHDKALRKEQSLLNKGSFKHLIITSAYLGTGIICVTLSFHAVILLAIPPLIAAQYRNQKNLFIAMMIATLVLVPVGVYGSFFLGSTDRNFIKGMMSEEEFSILANRLTLATSTRMMELLLHYVIPRLFCVIAIVLLVSGITKRNGNMLQKQAELDHKVKQEMERLTKMQRHVIDSLTTLIENRDVGTGEHVVRTRRYVHIIASALREHEKYKNLLNEDVVNIYEQAAPLHDVGKIVVSDTILLKPGKLTPEEFEAMKVHTVKGGKVIRDIFAGMEDEQFLRTAEQIAMFHHERWDGTGYPQGLKGEEIPLPARIMAVADVYDALVSVRSYKKSIEPSEALNIMMSESGTHFDPDIMQVVEKLRDKLVQEATLPLEQVQNL